MAINPMAFVTPYTAVGTGHRGGGASFANSLNQARSQQVSQGYLQNAQRQTATNEKRYGQQEIDKARSELDDAMLLGNQDRVELAANNLRAVLGRHGYSIAETRSDAQLKSGVTTDLGEQQAAVPEGESTGAELPPEPDTTAEQEAFFRDKAGRGRKPAEPPVRPPGGVLPSVPTSPGTAASPPMQPPGGVLPRPAASAAEPPGASEAPLRGYTINGPDGKPIYSVAPKDVQVRQRERVSQVFSLLDSRTEDPEERALIAQGQKVAEGLVGVVPIDKAVAEGLGLYDAGMKRRGSLAVVEANRKPRFGGGGGGGGGYTTGVVGKADAALNDDLDRVRRDFVSSEQYKNVVTKKVLVEGAQAQLASDNGMSQQEAVSTLRRIQSGLTLNAFETTEFNNAAGAIEGIYNRFNKLFGGGQLSPEYKRQLAEVYAKINQTLDRHTERLASEAYDYWVNSRKRAASPEIIHEKGEALKKSLSGGKGGGSDQAKDLFGE